jgi:hypothetical protein
MAVRFKLGEYRSTNGDDPLGRPHVGYFPRMTEQEAWDAGRGVWKMNRQRAARQKFSLIVGEGQVRAIGEVTGFRPTDDGDRVELVGHLLEAGHPVYDAYMGQPDPIDNGSQNPVAYVDLPEEAAFLIRACGCGCGEESERDFLPGHDVRAIQDRVREYFAGNPLAFINWLDTTLRPDPPATAA